MKLQGGEPVAGYLDEGYLDATGLTEAVTFAGSNVGVLRQGQFSMVANDARGTLLSDLDGTPRLASPFGDRDVHPNLAAALDFVRKGYDADLGFVRMGVRDYDPRSNRFTTPDPLFFSHPSKCLDSPVECNLYSYALNNPLTHHDPSGMEKEATAAASAPEPAPEPAPEALGRFARGEMVDIAVKEIHANPDSWATDSMLDRSQLTSPNVYYEGGSKAHPKYGYEHAYKCNIFMSEMLYRAGLQIPSPLKEVDLLVADIRASTPGGKDKLPSGAKQWFDPIAHGDRASQVKPGDVILINSAERHDLDHRASNGHVVIVSSVTRNSAGQITQLRTVGASTSTGRETANGGPNKTPTTFGTVQHGIFQFAAGTEVIRPRLAE